MLGKIQLLAACAGCGLTPRSRRGPTASHQARAGGTGYIFTGPGLASCRWSRLSSNGRPHKTSTAALITSQVMAIFGSSSYNAFFFSKKLTPCASLFPLSWSL